MKTLFPMWTRVRRTLKRIVRWWRFIPKYQSRAIRFHCAMTAHTAFGRFLLHKTGAMSTDQFFRAVALWKRDGLRLERVGKRWGLLTPNIGVRGANGGLPE